MRIKGKGARIKEKRNGPIRELTFPRSDSGGQQGGSGVGWRIQLLITEGEAVPVERVCTLGVAEAAAVTDAGAAAPLHALQVLLVVEVALVEGRREVGQHGVELAKHVRQVCGSCGVHGRRWGVGMGGGQGAQWLGEERGVGAGHQEARPPLPGMAHSIP